VLVAAGCGGGDGSGTTESSPATSAATGSSAPAEPASTSLSTAGEGDATTDTSVAETAPPTAPPATRIVDHEFGTTEVPAEPQRIVALSEEFLLADLIALGVAPIASTSNDATMFGGIDPAATGGIENIASVDFNVERLAALRPDLILAYPDYIELIGHDILDDVAPTVAIGDAGSDWDERFEMTAAVLGLEAVADERIEQIEAQLADARGVLGGTQVSVLSISPGPFIRAYTDDRTTLTEVIDDLGMEFVPDGGDTDDNGRIQLSLERLGQLTGELLVLLQTEVVEGEDAAVGQVTGSPLWSTLPAVTADAVITLDRLAYPGADGVARFAADLAAAVEALDL